MTPTDPPIAIRPATPDDLPACVTVWRTAINEYLARLNQPLFPEEQGPLLRLYAHTRATDPERFLVATEPAGDGTEDETVVAFTSAVVRGPVWFLSMLFIRPDRQARGLGRTLLGRVLPARGDGRGLTLATVTDPAQPVSNALYASHGIVPRVPAWYMTAEPDAIAGLPDLPSGIRPVPFNDLAAEPGGAGHRDLVRIVNELDLATAGFERPEDHRFLRTDSRTGILYLGPSGEPVAYGYVSESGRIGPIAARDPALIAAIIAHLIGLQRPRGAFATWISGESDEAFSALLRAGFRLDGFPLLLCWSRRFADFSRFLPISPGLL